MNALARYAGTSCTLLGAVYPFSVLVARRYGGEAGRRFAVGAAGMLVAQQVLVAAALRRGRGAAHRLSLVDLMTLSRGSAAAVLVGVLASRVRDRHGTTGWMAWLSLLYGAILCDWLDGPIARHLGTSEVGKMLDLEADSWLTLVASVSAARWGGLPRIVIAPPAVRYLSTFAGLRDCSYAELWVDEPVWVRRLGIVQMMLYIAALAPFGARITTLATRVVAPVQIPMQLAGLAVLHHRRRMR